MNLPELLELQGNIKRQLKKREQQEFTQAREKILAIAQSVDVSLKELIGSGSGLRAKTGTVAVQYRNPAGARRGSHYRHGDRGKCRRCEAVQLWTSGIGPMLTLGC